MNLISQILQDLSLIPTIITNSMCNYTPFRGLGVILLWFYQHNNICFIESPFSRCNCLARKSGGTICNIISHFAILGRGNCIRIRVSKKSILRRTSWRAYFAKPSQGCVVMASVLCEAIPRMCRHGERSLRSHPLALNIRITSPQRTRLVMTGLALNIPQSPIRIHPSMV